MSLILCHECRREILPTDTVCPHCGAALIQTRGLLTIILWGIAGLPAGAIVAPLLMLLRSPREKIDPFVTLAAMSYGSAIGALVGLCVGTFIWAFFPYKGKPPEQAEEESSEGADG